MEDGARITFWGQGDQQVCKNSKFFLCTIPCYIQNFLVSVCCDFLFQPGVEPGDVVIVLQQKPHEKFKRQDCDLYMTHKISLTEALCGFQFIVKHLDGRDIVVKHPAGQIIKPGTTFYPLSYANSPSCRCLLLLP